MDQGEVRKAVPSDVESVLALTTRDDVRCLESTGDSAEALLRSEIYSTNTVMTGTINGRPVCMFGKQVVSLLYDEIFVWLLGSTELRRYPKLFMKHCIPELVKLIEGHARVKTLKDPQNPYVAHWLRRLGFEHTGSFVRRGDIFFEMELH